MTGRKLLWAVFIGFMMVGTWTAAQEEPAQAPGFVPAWKVGDYWHLEASYRDLKNEGEQWLPPILWVFQVRAIKTIHRQEAYVVHAYPRNRDLKVQAVLFLSTRDLRPLRVIDIFPTPNGVKSQEREIDPFSPQPLLAQDSLVPYDLPLFPLVRKSVQLSDGFDAYRAPTARTFAKVANVGGLRFKSSVGQVDKKPEKHFADTFSSYRNSGELFQIELFDSTKQENLVQIWQENSPWALSTESPGRKVKLIKAPPTGVQAPKPQDQGGEGQ
jgi:hypothetical protein